MWQFVEYVNDLESDPGTDKVALSMRVWVTLFPAGDDVCNVCVCVSSPMLLCCFDHAHSAHCSLQNLPQGVCVYVNNCVLTMSLQSWVYSCHCSRLKSTSLSQLSVQIHLYHRLTLCSNTIRTGPYILHADLQPGLVTWLQTILISDW